MRGQLKTDRVTSPPPKRCPKSTMTKMIFMMMNNNYKTTKPPPSRTKTAAQTPKITKTTTTTTKQHKRQPAKACRLVDWVFLLRHRRHHILPLPAVHDLPIRHREPGDQLDQNITNTRPIGAVCRRNLTLSTFSFMSSFWLLST